MKKYFIIISLLGLLMVGCQDSDSILQPIESSNNDVLSKYENLDFVKSNADRSERTSFTSGSYSHFIGNEEIVELPTFKTIYTKNYTVKGEVGGVLFLKISWRDEKGAKVRMESKLTIPRGAFEGELTFDMIFDLNNYALELYPSPFTFDLPVLLDLKFWNIDLSNVDSSNLDFTYLDGEEEMKCKDLYVNIEYGELEVKGAELHHFSRYGWTRTR